MSNLTHRQYKIQEKRRHTPWRDFVMEIASRCPISFYKDGKEISRYPLTDRKGDLISAKEFNDLRDGEMPHLNIVPGTFFSNLQNLWNIIAKPRRWVFGNSENSEYSDTIGFGAKNFYLTICAGVDCSNVLYSFYVVTNCHDILNCIGVTDGSSNIYNCLAISKSYQVYFSRCIYNSSNIRFSSNLQGCSECLFCDDLANQSYCIYNKKYTIEEYFVRKQELLSKKNQFNQYYESVSRQSKNIGSKDSNGTAVMYSENIENGFLVTQVKDGRNLIVVGNGDIITNSYDCLTSATQADHGYANMGVSPGAFMYCSMNSGNVNHIYYSVYCENCEYILGCYGLKNKSYCIFNKQYTKEERYTKVDEIFGQMDSLPSCQGEVGGGSQLGDFFPPSMNPFYFNDTAAYLIDPSFTKEEVTAKGYLRRDEPIKVDIPDGMKIINIEELENYEGRMTNGIFTTLSAIRNPQSNNSTWYIDPQILDCIIQDEQGNIYKIVKMEYDFLVKHGLPLPRKHRLDRMKENFKIN